MNAMNPNARKYRSRASSGALLAVSVVAVLASGCLSLEPLRERRYSELTIAHLEKAGGSEDERVFDGVVGLLELRLENRAAVELDHALEAVAALMKIGRADAAAIVSRCAREDANEELRYMALEALVSLAPEETRSLLVTAADEDSSDLVREHAREILARLDTQVSGIVH